MLCGCELIIVLCRRGHHGRALEEAVLSNKAQWPHKWHGANPLHGGKSFDNMTPQERVCYCIGSTGVAYVANLLISSTFSAHLSCGPSPPPKQSKRS
jgi:hypothetical protein